MINNLNNNRSTIPKWIVVVPECDVIKDIEYHSFGASYAYGMVIEHMMEQMDRLISNTIANLPHKANRYDRPYILWVEPTLHLQYQNNALRAKFIKSMHIASQTHDRVVILPFKQSWNCADSTSITSGGSFTTKGFEQFWTALDSSIRFADTKVMRNHGLPLKQIFQKYKLQSEADDRIRRFEVEKERDVNNRIQLQRNQLRGYFNRRSNGVSPRRHFGPRPRPSNNISCRRTLFKDK